MKRILRVQRLARKEEGAIVKRIFYLTFFSILLAIFIFTLGIPLLGKFADALNIIFDNKNESQVGEKNIPRPPTIDQLPQATNGAKLVISGFSDEGTTVEIYLNSEKFGQVETKDRKFSFEDLVLKNGENKISAKAKADSDKESDFSQTQTVFLDKDEPSLVIENPTDGQSFSGNNRVRVAGQTDPDAQVYANGFLASINPEGKFEVFVPVPEGETTIEIKAIDEAGNSKIETRKVHFKQ